jgi:hypothetical protein
MYHNVRPTGPAVSLPVRWYCVKAAKSHPFPAQGDMPANSVPWRRLPADVDFAGRPKLHYHVMHVAEN